VYKHHYPRLSSMPRRMFEACRAISCTSVSMLSKGAINQSLSNTRRVHVEKDIFAVIEKGIDELTKYLHVKVATTDIPVTVSIRQLRVLPNTDVQVASTKFRNLNKGRKNRNLFHTSEQIETLFRSQLWVRIQISLPRDIYDERVRCKLCGAVSHAAREQYDQFHIERT
jgi:hypothetical protein